MPTKAGVRPLLSLVEGSGPIIATAIHAGHELRPEVEALMALDPADRRREEDPYTDRFTAPFETRVMVDRSRFEIDLNRSRDEAVYRTPEQSWGLDVWTAPLPDAVVERSLALHDDFYATMAAVCDALASRGRFVLLDLHSYNHRREGPDGPVASERDNPDVNLGTGTVDMGHWRGLADRFASDLMGGLPPSDTYGENVRFKGGYLSRWVNERYSGQGCALALEFKKSFMDEWADRLDPGRVRRRIDALAGTIPGLLEELGAGR